MWSIAVLNRIRKNFAEGNYGTLALELLVVIFGILIAFQIDRWGEERRDRELEREYLLRLKQDLQFEIERIDQSVEFAADRIEAGLFLEQVVGDPSIVAEQKVTIARAMETVSWRSFPQIDAIVYTELQTSGNLALIESVPLRRSLAEHYTSIRHYAQVGFDLDIQHQFDRLTAGILTSAELAAIERESWDDATATISAARAAEIADELIARPEAIEFIPNIVQHHVFNQKVMEIFRGRALQIIDQINEQLAGTTSDRGST